MYDELVEGLHNRRFYSKFGRPFSSKFEAKGFENIVSRIHEEKYFKVHMFCSDAVGGWAGWEFGSSVNPIPTKGADYAHHITDCPPGFENLVASLILRRP